MSADQTGAEHRAGRPPHTRVGVTAGALLVVTAAGVLTGSVLNLVTVERVIYVPGPVYDTLGQIDGTDIVSVDEGLTSYDDTDGHLYFTTIRLQGGPGDTVSAWEALRATIADRLHGPVTGHATARSILASVAALATHPLYCP